MTGLPSAEITSVTLAPRPGLRPIEASPEMIAFRNDLAALVNKHSGGVVLEHMLGISAYVTGCLAVVQSKERVSPTKAARIIKSNVELGMQQPGIQLQTAAVGQG